MRLQDMHPKATSVAAKKVRMASVWCLPSHNGTTGSSHQVRRLESIETGVEDAADEMLKAIQRQRRSKKPVRL